MGMMDSPSKVMSVIYNTVGLLPFALVSRDMAKDVFPNIKVEDCVSKGPFGPKECTEALDLTVGAIYLQVIVGMAFAYTCVLMIPGKKGMLAAMACFVLTMGKHIFVDGLIPPPPVMAMTAGTVAALLFAPGDWGKRIFVGQLCLNAATFIGNPLMVLQDTFAELEDGSEAYKIGAFCFEVISLYLVGSVIVVVTPSKTLGHALANLFFGVLLAKHVIIDSSGPPKPLVAWYVALIFVSLYEYGFADLPSKAEKTIKPVMKIHAMICAAGFVPMYALETVGISLPYMGMPSMDTSHSSTGYTSLLCGFVCIFLAMVVHDEYYGKMSGKMFCAYHYFLSGLVMFWQLQPTTTALGAAFLSLPHMFTAYCVYIVVTIPK